MKTAEDFRKDFGETEEGFRKSVLQTLRTLEYEEEQPVKKKISLGLVLALTVMLVTVTALAAGSWGILDFVQERGEEAAAYKLMVQVPQENTGSHWVDMTIDEALIDGGKAYLAMTVLPKEEKTIVVPRVLNIGAPGSMAVMNNPDYDMNMSVRAFAESKGYEKIVGFRPPMGLSLGELEYAKYESMDNGGLRCMLQYAYEPEEADFPEKKIVLFWEILVVQYREDDITPDHIRISPSHSIQLLAELQVDISAKTKRSIAADAHEIAGYDSTIEYVTMTPLEDGSVQFTMLMDADIHRMDKFYFVDGALLDAEGKQVCQMRLGWYTMHISNKAFWYGVIPAEHAEIATGDQVTIQLQKRVGMEWQEIDTHTYTME